MKRNGAKFKKRRINQTKNNTMRTIELKVFTFAELGEDAKKKVLIDNAYINVEHNWWKNTYEDAERIGLNITGFDLERNKHAKGKIIGTCEETAKLIEQEHGKDCETYKLAKRFLLELQETEDNTNLDSEDEKNGIIEDLETTFLNDLLELYADMLQKECDYLQTETAIIETIEANSYEFTEDGKMYH
jgi:hypothetical protein